MMTLKIKSLSFVFFLICNLTFGQISKYNYKRELTGFSGQWHKLTLPNEIFGKISPNFHDLRIFGITASNDTIEAPYLLRNSAEKASIKEINFKTINPSKNAEGYYFTFEIPTTETINQINLDFNQKNFDWQVTLEGSQQLNDWFTIADEYRILSIKNEISDFQFTKIRFPNSKFRYYRLQINSKEKPELKAVRISEQAISEATFRNYSIKSFQKIENKKEKQTEIEIELEMPVPASFLDVDIKNTFDYYRPITIKYLSDSIKTAKGWSEIYSTLTSGTLNSIDKNGFIFRNTIVQKLKVIINNHDNQPLNIQSATLKGFEHELIIRLDEKARYFLTYGNKSANKPLYDIDHFADKLPNDLTALKIGSEQKIDKENKPIAEPLFKNNLWLWAIMVLIILVLGWFSLKMMKKE